MKSTIQTLYTRLGRINDMIKAAQERCKHINLIKTPHANTGNYDPHNDYYWYEYHCQDCNKRWTEPQ